MRGPALAGQRRLEPHGVDVAEALDVGGDGDHPRPVHVAALQAQRDQALGPVDAVAVDVDARLDDVGLAVHVLLLGGGRQHPAQVLQGQLGRGRALQQAVRPGQGHQQARSLADRGGRQPPDQTEQADHPAMLDLGHGVPFDQVGGHGDVAGGQRVADRLGHQVVRGEPLGGPPVQPGHPVPLVALEPAAQVVGEQVVVAEPLPLGVQRAQEQIAPLQFLQHRLAVGAPAQRVGQLAAEPVPHAGVEQEGQDVAGQRVEHVLGQVLTDRVVPPGEAADQVGRIGAVPQRQRDQLQRRDPAVGADRDPCDVLGLEPQPVQIDQEGTGFGQIETQGVGVDLDQLAAHPQPAQRQPRPDPAGQHDREVGRGEVEQVHQGAVHLGVLDQVPVVEGQHQPPVVPADLFQQHRQGVGLGVLDVLLQQVPQVAQDVPGVRHGPTDGLQQVEQEPVRVVVVPVQSQPGRHRAAVGQHPQPLHGKRGLAVAGRGVDDHQGPATPLAQRVQQPLALDHVAHVGGRAESGGGVQRPGRCGGGRHRRPSVERWRRQRDRDRAAVAIPGSACRPPVHYPFG